MSDRKDFYFRQRVTQAELDAAFSAMEQADLRIVEDILGFGFLVGAVNPATVEENTVPDQNVRVNQFLGYDQLGRRLTNIGSGFQGAVNLGAPPPQIVDLFVDEVGAATTVTTPGNERILTIFIEFTRLTSDPRVDGNGANVFFQQDESIQFNVVQSAEAPVGFGVPTPARADQLILADVTRIFGQTAFANADIDQSRRQNFALALIHGASHAENGTDPVPNALAVVGQGGLLSGADKIKLDDVDFSATGIGTRLANTHYRDFQPANGVAPAATSIDVTGSLIGKSAGGTPLVEGVVTTAPDNTVIVRDDDGDDFTPLDSTNEPSKVFGRLTEAAGVWTLSFFIRDDALGETAFDMTPFAGSAFEWFIQEAYLVHNLPSANPLRSIPSDQVAAEVPTATTVAQGKGLAAPNSPLVPQMGSLNTVLNNGVDVSGGVPVYRINFLGGASAGPNPGEVDLSAGAGPPGPPGGPGPSGGPGPTGPPGPGYTSFISANTSRSITTNAGWSIPVATGFNWRDAHASVSLEISNPDVAGVTVLSVTGLGTGTLTINGNENIGLSSGNTARIHYSAAG